MTVMENAKHRVIVFEREKTLSLTKVSSTACHVLIEFL